LDEDKFLRVLWKYEIERINDHLPKKTKTLSSLLEEEEPYVISRDGSNFIIDKDELNFLASFIPEELHRLVRLPIVLIRRLDLGKGVFTISGGKLESFIIHKLLKNTNATFSEYKDVDLPPYIYWPHVVELRRRFKTIITIGFGVSKKDLSDAKRFLRGY